MTTTSTTTRATPATPPTSSAEGPIGRVVAGALVLGATVAVAVVAVLPGLSEAALLGGVLLAFSAGWAALARWSARFTSRRQRWARVPAAVFALLGAGLLIARPGDTLMVGAAWGWGPVFVALALFVGTRARRDLPRRGRVLVYPVAIVMVVAGVGGLAHVATAAAFPAPMPGRLIEVGGHRLHLSCTGSGSPTVVLLNGLGETSPLWSPIQDAASTASRVCAYDRAGQGWSDDARQPADAATTATDLHRLLAAAGERGPVILAGHSTGGVYALRFTAQYPDDVAGLVLLDSSSPHQAEIVPSFPTEYQLMRRGLAIAPTLMRLGVGDLLTSVAGENDDAYARFASSPRGFLDMRREQSVLPTSLEQAQELTSLGSLPLAVVTAGRNAASNPGWATAQDEMARLSTTVRHVTADVDHAGLVNSPTGIRASVEAITDVVREVRGAQLVTTP